MTKKIEDDMFYQVLGEVVRGKVLKQVLADYWKNPPSQDELNPIFAAWEEKTFRNRIKLTDEVNAWLVGNLIIIKSITGEVLWQEELPSEITNLFVEELKKRAKRWQKMQMKKQ